MNANTQRSPTELSARFFQISKLSHFSPFDPAFNATCLALNAWAWRWTLKRWLQRWFHWLSLTWLISSVQRSQSGVEHLCLALNARTLTPTLISLTSLTWLLSSVQRYLSGVERLGSALNAMNAVSNADFFDFFDHFAVFLVIWSDPAFNAKFERWTLHASQSSDLRILPKYWSAMVLLSVQRWVQR